MRAELREKILGLDAKAPWVWRLRLTEGEYRELEAAAKGLAAKGERDGREWAVVAAAYVAEWYKREYDGTVAMPLEGVTAEELWEASGFDAGRLAYRTAKTVRWLESLYVLGGLPMRRLMGKGKALKALCRIWKGDEGELEGDGALCAEQAAAFGESVRGGGSLYEFLKALLTGDEGEVYAREELEEEGSAARAFADAVKTAYDEVMRDKFRLEWLVEREAGCRYLRRRVRLRLRPEELGGLHHYLRFDRATRWGIADAMRQRTLRASLRFLKGRELVGGEETRRTVVRFENTGQEETGFEATGMETWGELGSVPVEAFDRVAVVVADDAGAEREVQTFDCRGEWMQLWETGESAGTWSSVPRSGGGRTAVLFGGAWEIEGAESEARPFWDRRGGVGAAWNFAVVEDHATLRKAGAEEVEIWRREGTMRLAPVLHAGAIRYRDGKVRYVGEDGEEEWLPAVFGKGDVRVRHFGRDGKAVGRDAVEELKVEWKAFGAGAYREWSDGDEPGWGKVKLRVTVRGEEKTFAAVHLPGLGAGEGGEPVVRDFAKGAVRWRDWEGKERELVVEMAKDGKPLEECVALRLWESADGEEYAEVDAWMPTLRKEVALDGKVSRYLEEGEEVRVPYLLCGRVKIRDFNRGGFFEYDCADAGRPGERGSMDAWRKGLEIGMAGASVAAPEYLRVVWGTAEGEGGETGGAGEGRMVYWEYGEEPPRAAGAGDGEACRWVKFQDMRGELGSLECAPPEDRNEIAGGGWDDMDWGDGAGEDGKAEKDAELLRCYDAAVGHGTYFFIFNPLFTMTEEEFRRGVCGGVRARRGGELTEEDAENLARCAAECGIGAGGAVPGI